GRGGAGWGGGAGWWGGLGPGGGGVFLRAGDMGGPGGGVRAPRAKQEKEERLIPPPYPGLALRHLEQLAHWRDHQALGAAPCTARDAYWNCRRAQRLVHSLPIPDDDGDTARRLRGVAYNGGLARTRPGSLST